MTNRFHRYLAALPVLFAAAAGYAADSAVNLTGQGFCLRREEAKCEEVAMAGMLVTIERLPKDEDGKRVIYFYSDQDLKAKGAFVHVLESEDSDPEVIFRAPGGGKAAAPNASLKAMVDKLKPAGTTVITPFQMDKTDKVRVFSAIHVDGPGVFSGRVVDMDGHMLGTGERVSFTVIRDPGPNARSQQPVSSGHDDGYE
jgi:hypothetical protein